ncbi:hypothetical protein AB0395_48175 [Streptosporangium sp. NPDC051023]|uniref:hypothetical protein n=1 Tax=Streptosporangium sp. NPDC051023 TaxID=3155410 RepID=UPI003450F69A
MLARGCEYGSSAHEARARLTAWTSGGEGGQFAIWARRGAADGIVFAAQAGSDPAPFAGLNDPLWLRHRFEEAQR